MFYLQISIWKGDIFLSITWDFVQDAPEASQCYPNISVKYKKVM